MYLSSEVTERAIFHIIGLEFIPRLLLCGIIFLISMQDIALVR